MGEDGHTASLRTCRQMLVLVSGEGKEEALRAWRAGEDLPVTRVADLPQARVLVERNLLETAP